MKTQIHKTNSYKRYRFMFFNFGLVLSLLLTITAFEWRFDEKSIALSISDDPCPLPIYAIPITTIAPPKPPEVIKTKKASVSPKIIIVKKVSAKQPEIIYTQSDTMPDYIDEGDISDEKINEPDPERYPEIKAIPPNGFEQFYNQVKTEVGNSIGDREKFLLHGKKTRIFVSFVVEINGSISNVEMSKGFTGKVNRAAMKCVVNSGRWKHAYKNGKRVSQVFTLPIRLLP